MNLFTNEIVFRGHPDKVCDQISGAILDECLKQDKNTRAGIEVCGGKGIIFVTGELTTNAKVDIKKIVKRVLSDVGYSTDYKIIDNLGKQSNDIALGVDKGGAGDNGIMFGYAINETPALLPLAQVILQEFAEEYDKLRLSDSAFLPDGKAEIVGLYNDYRYLVELKKIIICYQNTEKDRVRTDNILKNVINNILEKYNLKCSSILFNPTGRFEKGGFDADAGLTGRKIVVDSYEGFAPVGGGNLNGKDPTKVDLTGAYKARELAKRLIKGTALKWVEVQISYAIGLDVPLSISFKSSNGDLIATPKYYEECRVSRMIDDLKMNTKNYEELAKFGHFRD